MGASAALGIAAALGRLLTDEDFRQAFFANPEPACRAKGFDLTGDEIAALVRVDRQTLGAVARSLDQRIVRASGGSLERCNGMPQTRR